jgi:rod shape determining protein RodA
LAFLPQQHTDFIFSVVGEEAGFWGSLLVIALFFVLIARGYYLALHSRSLLRTSIRRDQHAASLSCGVNMAMTVGLLPSPASLSR